MTIIASIQRSDAILTVSDIMLSSKKRFSKGGVELPLQSQDLFKLTDQHNPAPQELVVSGTSQKSVIFADNSLALWAGSAIIASVVIKEIAESHQQGRRESLDAIIQRSGLSPCDTDQISLIVFKDDGVRIVQDTLNTDRIERASASIIFQGTGSYPAIHDLDDAELGGSYSEFVRLFLDRVMIMLVGDVISQDNALYNFGGWFEITCLERAVFTKMPYAVKLWRVNEYKVFDGPGFVSGYQGHDLTIFSLDKRSASARFPFFIPDFLKRSGRMMWDGSPPDRPHQLEFHLIYFDDLRRTACVVLEQSQLAITVNVSRTQFEWSVNPGFLKELWEKVRAGSQVGHNISRFSIWRE